VSGEVVETCVTPLARAALEETRILSGRGGGAGRIGCAVSRLGWLARCADGREHLTWIQRDPKWRGRNEVENKRPRSF
jgi:hypothetical protein